MNNIMTELEPTNLIAVKMPIDSYGFRLGKNRNHLLLWNEGHKHFSEEFRYKILGEVTKDKIGFDVKSYLWNELKTVGYIWMDYKLYDHEATEKGNEVIYKDKRPHKFDEPEDSFYSLLEANGIYFVNPLRKPDLSDVNGRQYDPSTDEDKAWQEYNHYKNKIVKGKLLIIEKI